MVSPILPPRATLLYSTLLYSTLLYSTGGAGAAEVAGGWPSHFCSSSSSPFFKLRAKKDDLAPFDAFEFHGDAPPPARVISAGSGAVTFVIHVGKRANHEGEERRWWWRRRVMKRAPCKRGAAAALRILFAIPHQLSINARTRSCVGRCDVPMVLLGSLLLSLSVGTPKIKCRCCQSKRNTERKRIEKSGWVRCEHTWSLIIGRRVLLWLLLKQAPKEPACCNKLDQQSILRACRSLTPVYIVNGVHQVSKRCVVVCFPHPPNPLFISPLTVLLFAVESDRGRAESDGAGLRRGRGTEQ